MAVKHDMVAENQNASGAQPKQNVVKLQMLLRLVRAAEPNTYEQFCEAIVKYLCQEQTPTTFDSQTIKLFNETLLAYRTQLMDLCSDSSSEMSQLLVHGCLKVCITSCLSLTLSVPKC